MFKFCTLFNDIFANYKYKWFSLSLFFIRIKLR